MIIKDPHKWYLVRFMPVITNMALTGTCTYHKGVSCRLAGPSSTKLLLLLREGCRLSGRCLSKPCRGHHPSCLWLSRKPCRRCPEPSLTDRCLWRRLAPTLGTEPSVLHTKLLWLRGCCARLTEGCKAIVSWSRIRGRCSERSKTAGLGWILSKWIGPWGCRWLTGAKRVGSWNTTK